MISIAKVMADNKLDAIVHKSVEHQPTLDQGRHQPALREHQGRADVEHVPGLCRLDDRAVGIYADNLPVGITFFGRPYSEPTLLKLAYAYEQATHHRVPPKTTPALPRATAEAAPSRQPR